MPINMEELLKSERLRQEKLMAQARIGAAGSVMNKAGIMSDNLLLRSLTRTFKTCLDIAEKKNSDYATQDDPFKNIRMCEALGIPAETGLLVRMCDKFSRLSTIQGKEAQVAEESYDDTIIDFINYLAILKAWRGNKRDGTLPNDYGQVPVEHEKSKGPNF